MKRRHGALGVAGACAAVWFCATQGVQAAPQWNTGLESGVCGSGSTLGLARPGWCNAVHGDVLFLNQRSDDFGIGPSLRVGTARFSDLRLDAGLSVLIPVLGSFPLVLEAGPHLRDFHEPGVYGSAFFGLRSFNYYGHYEMAAGLSIIAERSFSTGTPSALWITARVDGALIALPFLFAYNALK